VLTVLVLLGALIGVFFVKGGKHRNGVAT
jgi:hypothetical protein